jgi:hypothetical protein
MVRTSKRTQEKGKGLDLDLENTGGVLGDQKGFLLNLVRFLRVLLT